MQYFITSNCLLVKHNDKYWGINTHLSVAKLAAKHNKSPVVTQKTLQIDSVSTPLTRPSERVHKTTLYLLERMWVSIDRQYVGP